MESFIRWLMFVWYLVRVCQSQLSNLRPLKGMLNDFDRSINVTEERDEQLLQQITPVSFDFTLPIPVSGDGFVGGVVGGGFGGGSSAAFGVGGFARTSSAGFGVGRFAGGSSATFGVGDGFSQSSSAQFGGDELTSALGGSGVGFSAPSFSAPLQPVFSQFPAQQSLIEISINEGAEISQGQIQSQSSKPASLELELSSKFHAAFRRADEEAEKASCVGRALIETTKVHAERLNLPFDEAVRNLTMMQLNQEMCQKILKDKDCEDFKRPAPCSATDPYRRMDGSCNNLDNPTWGKAMTPFVRYNVPAYENHIDSMRGAGREGVRRLPSPRTVSYKLQSIQASPPLRNITLMVMQWGQFIDHDLTFTAETQIRKVKSRSIMINTQQEHDESDNCPRESGGNTVPLECCPEGNPVDDEKLPFDCRPINVTQDPLFTGHNRTCMRFVRSLIASKGCELGPREQLNQITSYLDGSMIYGSTQKVADILRKKGQGGHLQKTDEGNLLPRNCCEDRSFKCFKAGDTRVNEQPGLTSMHTLWLRVHEQIVSDFASENPHWDDETLYQETRRVVIALIQQTTYQEFLPVVLGPEAMREEDLFLLPNGPGITYNPTIDASVANVVATAAFRFGHTLVDGALRASGGKSVPLVGNFENAKVLFKHNTRPSAFLEGLANFSSQAPDARLNVTLTNKLFSPSTESIGLDLMSLNIQRGRDHGLAPYTSWRSLCNLPTFSSFEELSSIMPSEVIQVFKKVYSHVDEIDLFPASLSEKPVDGGLVGPTFACLLSQQFSSLKKGDRFFFQNLHQPKPFTSEQLASISKLTLASIICRHSEDIQFLQPSVFYTVDVNGNDRQPCSSYPTLDTSLWKDRDMPPIEQMQCWGVGPFRNRKHLDHWCTINCFHVPSFCPPTHCSCKSNL